MIEKGAAGLASYLEARKQNEASMGSPAGRTASQEPSLSVNSTPSRDAAGPGAGTASGVERGSPGKLTAPSETPSQAPQQSEFLAAVREVIQATSQATREAAQAEREAAREERDRLAVTSDGMGGGLAGIKFEQNLPTFRDTDTDFDRH